MKKNLKSALILLLCAGWFGCGDSDDTSAGPDTKTTIETSDAAIVIAAQGGKKFIEISANSDWSIKPEGGWIGVAPAQGNRGITSVAVSIDPVQDNKSRSSQLLITSANSMKEISIPVFQTVAGDNLLLFPSGAQTFEKDEATLEITVMCNGEYNVGIEESVGWISQKSTEVIAENVRRHTFSIAANEGRIRNGSITFAYGSQSDMISITQNGIAVIPDKEGATIKGEITCEGKPMKGVVVSDGFEVTTTDDDGLYWLNSAKKNGYVFISIPGGYMIDCQDGIPMFWQPVTSADGVVEEHSFQLKREPNDDHILLVTTDPHMANRQKYNARYTDTKQYREDFRASVDTYVRDNSDKAVYAICLGDLTWDIYWYDKGTLYTLEDYRKEISTFPVPYFQVIGNHDYDMKYTDDFKATEAYRTIIGPTYYSFNLGDIHYVVLDNMVYKNINEDRSHDTYVDSEQIAWLKKDLATVDKNKPVFVCMHCPAYTVTGVSNNKIAVSTNFTTPQQTAELGDCFAGFKDVHYISGHTHINRAIANEDMPAGYENIFEHNVGAICATWWWTGYISKNSICKDGSEGGYMIFDLKGDNVKWRWKGMKVGDEKQFRAYDMNTVKDYYSTDASAKAFLNVYPSRTTYSKYPANTVLLNVWNWDSGWSVSVKENGQPLTVTHIREEDPLHTLSYDIPRTVESGSTTSSFRTYNTTHIFSVTTSSPTSTLQIEVTDRFGTKYHETMIRPKAFTVGMP